MRVGEKEALQQEEGPAAMAGVFEVSRLFVEMF